MSEQAENTENKFLNHSNVFHHGGTEQIEDTEMKLVNHREAEDTKKKLNHTDTNLLPNELVNHQQYNKINHATLTKKS